jgi:transposase
MVNASLPLDLGLPECWLPDETLFSLCSRYHFASGNHVAGATCKALFGHARQGSAHDFPAHLDHFARVAGPALGTVSEILEARTIVPLYLRFSSQDLARRIRQAAASGSAAGLKADLGLLAGRFRANHPLKACPVCIAEDRRDCFTAYWHREHQFPGVWVCLRHGCTLQPSDLKSTGVGRFDWTLPDPARFQTGAVPAQPTAAAIKLARMVLAIASAGELALSPGTLGLAHRAGLKRRGLLRAGPQARLNHGSAGGQYMAFIRELSAFDELTGLPGTPASAAAEIARLTSPTPTGVHPLRHLALASWLFEDPGDFIGQCRVAEQGDDSDLATTAKAQPAEQQQDPRQEAFLALVRGGRRVSGAAREIGVQPQTGMAWAAAHGISTSRRPKTLGADVRRRLVSLLREGASKSKAAQAAGVTVQTVTRLLRTEVGLREAWRQAQFGSAQTRHRKRWERALNRDPAGGVSAARLVEAASYAWLNRNDHDWLAQRNERSRIKSSAPYQRVDWDARDTDLAAQVQRAGLEIGAANPSQKIKLWQIYQRLPRLKAVLSRIERLPLTQAAITAVLSAPALERGQGLLTPDSAARAPQGNPEKSEPYTRR